LPLSQLLLPLFFGAGWGIAQVLVGISFVRVGMALTFAIVVGISATLGTLIPLLTLEGSALLSAKGLAVLIGLIIMIAGVSLCGKAGRQRERAQAAARGVIQEKTGSSSYTASLAITIISGILTPMLNYALAFGTPVLKEAVGQGASHANAPYAVWLLALLGGMPVNVLYCIYLLNRNKTWAKFGARSYDWAGAVLMGILWMAALALYGVGTTYLGPSGAALGWGLYSIFIVLAANLSAVIVGEWRGVGKRPLRTLGLGLTLLTIASVILIQGKR
jgi:L-rhamnose-H+ transport protein